MYQRSSRFDRFVANSHRVVHLFEVLNLKGEVQTGINLYVDDGQLSVDDTAIRRTADVTLIDADGSLTPDDARDFMAPGQSEFRISRGLAYPDGTTEVLPLGIFRTTDLMINDSGPSLTMHATFADRARVPARFRALEPMHFASQSVLSIIQVLVRRAYPNVQFSITAGDIDSATPKILVSPGDDTWDLVQKLGKNLGAEVYFDVYGRCVISAVPNYDTVDISWYYIEDNASTMLSIQRRMYDEDTYNVVLVTGGINSSSIGVAKDMNPASPTYVLAPNVNEIVYFITDENIASSAQAAARAEAELQKRVGLSELFNLSAIPHPCFEIGDVVKVERVASKVNSRYIIDKISVPLTHLRPMSLSMRRRRML